MALGGGTFTYKTKYYQERISILFQDQERWAIWVKEGLCV